MDVIFTICSTNYMAHALVLGRSVVEQEPNAKFVIGLVDKVSADTLGCFGSEFEIIPVDQLQIPAFQEMERKYNVVELNTAVKPFYMEHLYARGSVTKVIYLDPDILVTGPFKDLLRRLDSYSIVLTPHHCTSDNSAISIYFERTMLGTGVFNLGFIATRRSKCTDEFLKWWQFRLRDYCHYWGHSGIFVDQFWITILPAYYFDEIYIERNPGYNMSYWNYFERELVQTANGYLVNGIAPLIFHHFSSYDPDRPDLFSKRDFLPFSRKLEDRPDLIGLFQEYRRLLFAAGYQRFRHLTCAYGREHYPVSLTRFERVSGQLKGVLSRVPAGLRSRLKRAAQLIEQSCS